MKIPTTPLGISTLDSPSLMIYQSMLKTMPLSLLTTIVGKMFYAMQKARGIDLADETDPTNYQALDSLVLNKTNSGK